MLLQYDDPKRGVLQLEYRRGEKRQHQRHGYNCSKDLGRHGLVLLGRVSIGLHPGNDPPRRAQQARVAMACPDQLHAEG